MKIFAIRDGSESDRRDLAYLLYYEIEKRFYIELPENADPWETPLLLSSFAKKGETSINSYWSKAWVQQRIPPTDRQNIGQLLKDNGIQQYDEFDLLMLSEGRCAQDEYYLVKIDEVNLPPKVRQRFLKRVEDVTPLENHCLLVFFRDGVIKKCDLNEWMNERPEFGVLTKNESLFWTVRTQVGGYGATWDVNLNIDDKMLYKIGKTVPMSVEDFRNFVRHSVVNSSEAAEILGCSRQNIMDLTQRGRLHPIKSTDKNTLYLKSEILKRDKTS